MNHSVKNAKNWQNSEKPLRNVQMVCDLFDLALAMKSLALKRSNPNATEKWIFDEALRLIELGCR